MVQTVQELGQLNLLQVSKPKTLTHGMKVYSTEEPLSFKLEGVTTPFGPSVFNGTGEEARQSLVFSIPEDVHNRLKNLEDDFKTQLTVMRPNIDSVWFSSLKPSTGNYEPTFRAKINVKGDRVCKFYGPDNEIASAPENWRGCEMDVVVRVGGAYTQQRGAGALFEVTHARCGPNQVGKSQNPFA